jgi:O-antigen ligase
MLQNINKYVNITNLLSALLLVVFGLFPHNIFLSLALALFFVSYLCEVFLEKRWKTFVWDKTKWVFILFLMFYALIIIYIPFESERKFLSYFLEVRLPFLAFGIVGLLGINKYYRLKYFAYTFIFTILCVIFYLIFFKIGIVEFINNPQRAYIFTEMRIEHVYTHMVFNYYANISLILAYFLIYNYNGKHPVLVKTSLLISMLFLFYILFLSEGRIGFISANLLVLIMIFVSLWRWKKILALAFSVLGIFAFAVIMYQHPRMIKSGDEFKSNIRTLLWGQAIELIKEKPVFGYGASTAADLYMKASLKNQAILDVNDYPIIRALELKIPRGAHPHNQFLLTTLEFGLFGLLILILLNILPVIVINKERRLYVFLIIMISVIQLMTDIYARGVPVIAFFILMTVFFCAKDDNLLKQVNAND